MFVKLIGFNLKVEGTGKVDFSSFVKNLSETNQSKPNKPETKRLLFINNQHNPEYHVGLVVTIKDHRTFCELVKTGDNLLVKVNKLQGNSSLMDFNFFVINKNTGAGLYQYYHQSCSANAFGATAARKFSEYRESELKKALTEAEIRNQKKSEIKKIQKEYRNYLRCEIIIRSDALISMIAEMKRVKSFEYSLSTPSVPESSFAPLKPYIRRKSERLNFSVGTPVQTIANALSSFVLSESVERGRIEGVDEDGIPRILKILNNPDSFGEYDYDTLAPKLNELDLEKFHQSWVISELIEKCKNNKAIFEFPEAL